MLEKAGRKMDRRSFSSGKIEEHDHLDIKHKTRKSQLTEEKLIHRDPSLHFNEPNLNRHAMVFSSIGSEVAYS